MEKKVKILVVGQGLAGTLLSNQLFKNNIDFHVIDNNHFEASTKIAAGLINPITGRRYVKSWMIDELLPNAIATYDAFEKLLNINIVNRQNILRTLRTAKQINMWDEVSMRPGYEAYVEQDSDPEEYASIVKDVMRFGEIKASYRIDIALLISAYKTWLLSQGLLTEDIFDYNAISYTGNEACYKGETYSRIIFCEGHGAQQNPYFNKLGFQMAKGEVLMLKIDNFNPKKILRDEIFMVPNNSGLFWSGGGYKWDFTTGGITEEWKNEWLKKISKMTDIPFKIELHKAGIRPCVLDRKPLLGTHPEFEQIVIFNGLGTKGTSLGPYFAEHLYNHLFQGEQLLDEVNCRRYLS